MRGFIPGYEFRKPRDFQEALTLLSESPGTWKPFAGGTDLMVLLESGLLKHKKYIDVTQLSELTGIVDEPDYVEIGALTSFSQMQAHPLLKQNYPLLCDAATSIGALAIQNRGTLGGNIANASPAADTPPVLLAYDAELKLTSTSGTRVLPYSEFHLGYKKTALCPDELIHSIRLPKTKANQWQHEFRKVSARKAQVISKIVFAALIYCEGGTITDLRVALGSVGATVLRLKNTERALKGQRLTPEAIKAARNTLASEISPISDIRSTADYRLKVAQNVLGAFLERSLEGN